VTSRSADTGLAVGAVGYGVVVGGTSGSGVILLSLLMAAGLEGAAVIATDAVISVATSIIKISVFGLAGVITAQVIAFAVLIGAVALPGAFLAKAFVEAHAAAYSHRDPGCGGDRRRRGDDFRGGASLVLGEYRERPKTVSSAERESQQARAQQHKAGRCQREESIGNQIVIAHDKPAV